MGNSISNFSTADEPSASSETTPDGGAPAVVDVKAEAEREADEVVEAATKAVEVSDELHGTLHVTLTRAEDIDNVALQGDMSLVVKCTFLGQSFKTPVAEGSGQNAEFNYEFTLPLDGVLGTMFVEVSHHDAVSGNNTIGFGDVSVRDLVRATSDVAFDITRDGETPIGRVYFKARFEPQPHLN